MRYSSAEIINPEFFNTFIDTLSGDEGKKLLDKVAWYLSLDGFDKDSHINAYRNGARDLLGLIKKWSDPQYKKQVTNRREAHDRAKHESDNQWSSGASIGEFSGANSSTSNSRSKPSKSSKSDNNNIVVR